MDCALVSFEVISIDYAGTEPEFKEKALLTSSSRLAAQGAWRSCREN
jgi:hypothetical protein